MIKGHFFAHISPHPWPHFYKKEQVFHMVDFQLHNCFKNTTALRFLNASLTNFRYMWWRHFHLWKNDWSLLENRSTRTTSFGNTGSRNYTWMFQSLLWNGIRMPCLYSRLWRSKMLQNGPKYARSDFVITAYLIKKWYSLKQILNDFYRWTFLIALINHGIATSCLSNFKRP